MNWENRKNLDLTGKVILLTGATSGIGLASMQKLVKSGAYVIGVGRSKIRNEKAKQSILSMVPGAKVDFLLADLASQSQVRHLAREVENLLEYQKIKRLDVLINNAGIYLEKKNVTEENIETTFATNHLAAFLLTHELMPLLKNSQDGRILTVSSYAHRNTPIVIKRLPDPKPYFGLLAYKRSKLSNVLFAYEFNRKFDHNPLAIAIDPGLVDTSIASKGSDGISDWIWRWRRKNGESPDVPAEAIAYQSGTEKIDTSHGYYFVNGDPQVPSKSARNGRLAEKLWELSCKLTNINW
jgi:NAD(P)-dependent dehydrogenase (short-subunit alcohol dehydrogenase family)